MEVGKTLNDGGSMQWLLAVAGLLATVASLIGLVVALLAKWPFHE